jgi:flagellar biosynthesis/type III secretory pathway protein FliH
MARIVRGSRRGARIESEVLEAGQRARELVERAEAEAGALRAAAEAERDRIRAEAETEGRREGLARVGAALVEVAAERDRRLAAVEREVVALAIEVAGKILGRTAAVDPAAAMDLAVGALAAARGRRDVALRVHPADAAALRAGEARLRAVAARAHAIEIREDPGLARGDVVVETEAGRIDARLATRLSLLARALEEVAG